MVILRIWPPSQVRPDEIGFSSLSVGDASGGIYMSVRPLKPEVLVKRRLQTATLEDDVEAEGVMLPPMWVYTRLNEAVMVRVWDQYKGDVATDWNGKNSYQNNCFRFCDMVMAAGQGHAIDTKSHESLSRRAAGSLQMATLATSDAALSERAEHYLKVQLW